MVVSTRRMSKRTLEPVDQWLAKEGYFRKPTPRDPTCLFRAISEQVYHTQHYHLRVRKECTDFMIKRKHLFMNTMTSFDYYLKEMQCFTEWGGPNEIRAMSLLYKRDIIIFVSEKQICENVTNNGFKKGVILLCHTEPKQYEPVYPMAFVQSAAYCQSIVYEVVYRYLYQMPNIKTVADKMLNNRNTAFRHDRFFQKGNLDIREQLIEDLYKKVKNEHSDTDEVQSDWKGIPPIPYKVAKALAPDYYRNIELDIWHELKREVKSAGWNRYNSNELQVGGKCLIEISINDLEQCDRNNNKSLRSNPSDHGGENNKIEQQKLKQGPLWLHGYIQEMHTNREPVLVFIKDLGEKKFVPYDALKPLPVVRKNKQKNWVAVNRTHSVNSDSSRRWNKSYNSFSRKKKGTLSMVHGTTSNPNKNIIIKDDNNNNNNDSDNINNINQTKIDERNDELSTIDQCQTENQSLGDRATNEETNSLPVMVALNNSQSTASNSVAQKGEEHKKVNSCTKLKMSDENYCSPCNANQQINMNGNPNVSYVVSDNAYPVYPYMSGNFGEHNQMDHSFASNFFCNLHLLHLEDSFRTLSPTYYGPMMYGPGHHGMQPLGAPSGNAHVPSMPEEMEHLANGMQNCSLTYSEGPAANDDISNTSHRSISGAQNARQPKQELKSLNGKDPLYQVGQKGKQSGTAKGTGNKARNRQQNRGSMYSTQHSGQQYGTSMMNTAYDTCRNDAHVVQHGRSWDPLLQHLAPNGPNAYASPQYVPPPGVFPSPIPYQEMPSHYTTNDGILGNPSPYYPAGNGSYVPMPPYLPPQHIDVTENATMPSYPQHVYSPSENPYSSNQQPTASQPMLYSQPVMYPQPMQYHALLPPHVQEQWNPMLGPQPYIQCAAPNPPQVTQIVEPSSNGQCTTSKGSL
ncbi:OTU domain-containing protein 4 isoform X2 [Camponotus floridanus]|uniref:OTU domain-containing protein 4 isoform X2 n=1 Tax=Camponotus floridanus TaxID=104421 RepID=UPI0009717338|nr:OTU domain-containing protein 4 isoform X2 [Camponotus floridanus]